MLCPDGADSWYRFKQDKAKGTSLYKPGPGLPDNIIELDKFSQNEGVTYAAGGF